MELVTVICARDEQDILLQAHSIDTFIEEPCVHWITVEDGSKSLYEWYDILEPYYKRHTLKLCMSYRPVGIEFPSPFNLGYRRQMTEKLKSAASVQSKTCLLLDAKNIFVRPTELSRWPYKNGSGKYTFLEDQPEDWFPRQWINYIHERTGLKIPSKFPPHLATPFAMTTEYVRNAVNHPLFESLYFTNDAIPMTETFYYNFFVPENEFDTPGPLVCNAMSHLKLAVSIDEYVTDNMEHCQHFNSPTHGAHRRLRALMPRQTKDKYKNWLIKRGLDEKLVTDYVEFIHADVAIGQ
jgi:hypothetical protein